MRIAEFERAQQQFRGGVGIRRRAVGVRQVHAAQADGGDGERAELTLLHDDGSRSG